MGYDEILYPLRQAILYRRYRVDEKLEDDKRLWLVHDLPTEAQVLVLYPEAHLISLLAANLAYLRHGIRFEPVVADGVVEHGGELVADRMQVSLRVFESIARAHDHELVFPVEDAKSRDLVHALVP